MPARLRPTAPIAADAVLVGDPGRALMLAQALLEQPKMSNHARGLWGYSGRTPAGQPLTIQATGMGGPSAALVLADLAELGVRRAIRVGTCVAIEPRPRPGDPLTILEAHAWGGGGTGVAVLPDGELTARLRRGLGQATRPAVVASLDAPHGSGRTGPAPYAERVDAADMQTAALFATAETLGLAIAAVLVVAESAAGEQADDELIESAAKLSGAAAATALTTETNPKVEG
jgi:purine-nucleoside phosphorylase